MEDEDEEEEEGDDCDNGMNWPAGKTMKDPSGEKAGRRKNVAVVSRENKR